MKRLKTIIIFLLIGMGMYAQTAAKLLLDRLETLREQGIMVGQQDATVYGTTWKWDEGRCDVKELTGDYPAIIGFDLGKLELDSDKNLDNVPFERMQREILAQHARGGIVTLSWHPWNPVTGNNAWDPEGNAVREVLPGGKQHDKFNAWLDKVANFILSLRTWDGKKVPVIFRPWHEMSGGWFWWGNKSCTPEEYIALYRYTHDQLGKAYGCDNIVWAYSPNVMDGQDDEATIRTYYPGNAYVDLIGFDIYEFDADNASYARKLRKGLQAVMKVAEKEGKIGVLSETGCRDLKDPTWFTELLWPVLKDFRLSYVLFWRNAWDQPEERYLPAKGDPAANDFVKFTQQKEILLTKDITKQ